MIMIIDEDDRLFYLDTLCMSIRRRAHHRGRPSRRGLHSRFHIKSSVMIQGASVTISSTQPQRFTASNL
jgi:hypothetical protein